MNGIELTVLGSSSGFPTPMRRSPSIHLKCGRDSVLLDCGEGASSVMAALGIPVSGLHAVLLTHMHADHIGGLLQLVQTWQIGQWQGYTPEGYSPIILAPSEGVVPLKEMLATAYLMPEVIAPLTVRFTGADPGHEPSVVHSDGVMEVRALNNSHLARLSCRIGGPSSRYQRFQALSYSLTHADTGIRIVQSGDVGKPEELDPFLSEPVDVLITELAHFTAETLRDYLGRHSTNIGALVVNHIGPRYDEKADKAAVILEETGIERIFMGSDGLRLNL